MLPTVIVENGSINLQYPSAQGTQKLPIADFFHQILQDAPVYSYVLSLAFSSYFFFSACLNFNYPSTPPPPDLVCIQCTY